MNTLHVKSPCCSGKIRRFGHKRRQCGCCKRTWSIRPKKRGRPHVRLPPKVLQQIFVQGFTPQLLGRRRPQLSLPTFRYRVRQAIRSFIARPSPQKIPRGPLILLADGLWFNFRRKHWILYLTALKPCSGNTSVFLDPILLPGQEGASKWRKVFARIPGSIQTRIRALVVDNLNGMKKLTTHYHWILQLCHFHLLLKLRVRSVRQRRTLKGARIRKELYKLIRCSIETKDEKILQKSLVQLNRLARNPCGTKRMGAIVRDFLKSASYFRSYITFPDLQLPTTTNAVESMGCLVRDLLRRNRCASSPRALHQWVTAMIRMRPYVTCNGKKSTD